jgi:spore coat protein A
MEVAMLFVLSTWILAGAASIASAPVASTLDVNVYSFDFSVNPPGQPVVDAVITVGDTVRWVWVEGNHTTTSVSGIPEQWDATLGSGSPTFSHTFTNVGTFWYYCRPHGFDNGDQTAGGMAGTVTVLPAGTGACCLPNGTCTHESPASCLLQGGTYQGDGTSCAADPCPNQPITVPFAAQKDNILYEDAAGAISNGAGRYLYTGNQTSGQRRRSVIRFDLGSIPAGALIQSASLELHCSQSQGSAVPVALHRLHADWGEGTSDASGDESSGTTATVGDATWRYRYYATQTWLALGGDYELTPSASRTIGASNANYAWASSGVVVDVQSWVAAPGSNFGWIVIGDDASSANVKRFDSRQSSTPSDRPSLTITYIPAAPTGACCLPSGDCTTASAAQCVAQGGTYQGDGSPCTGLNCPLPLTPFVDPLPLPAVAQPVTGIPGGAAHYDIPAREILQRLHRDLPLTRVWGYGGSYPGPTIEARRGQLVTVTWINDLRDLGTGELRTEHALAVDTCLHGPDETGVVPVLVTHLHGGHVPGSSDGYPESRFPPGQQSPVYSYPNEQPAATLWYHDHALGITRLNVYMGLAGFYLLRDDAEDALNLPLGEFEVPLAIQDRMFRGDGSLYYPAIWEDHFFGDTVLVNGKVWPYFDVKRGKYRFRMLNGSTSRTYSLSLSTGAVFWQIGSDTGLLTAPVALSTLTLSPGERADVVIDFAPYAAGTAIVLTNSAPSPFPGSAGVGVVPNVMQFRVQAATGDVDPLPASLVPVPPIDPATAVLQRDLVLRQMPNTMCPSNPDGVWLIDGLTWHDITERPRLGTAEIWAWVNRSPITHPMHMHLVAFQVLDRQSIDPVTGLPIGPREPPATNERGWKDTVQAPPSQITRVIARFEDYTGRFPYHCHILEHEDHEMMRQFQVIADADADGVEDGVDNCPNVANADQADADGDRTGDACDACTDTDDDGYGDPGYPANTCALDGCPSDPAKHAPGVCGCGVPDQDGDGDGIADCVDPFAPFCFPGVNGVVTCPCGNPPTAIGRGCNNFGAGPAESCRLDAVGSASLTTDTLLFTSSGENNTSLTIFIQGSTSSPTGFHFGAGVRCVSGTLKRLYSGNASNGSISRPLGSDPKVHVRSAALGDPLSAGSVRYYFTYYRDPGATVPCGNPGSTFNSGNAGTVTWGP